MSAFARRWLTRLGCLLMTAGFALGQGFLEPDPRSNYPNFLGFRPADGWAVDVNPPRFSWPFRPGIVGASDEARRLFRFQVDADSEFYSPLLDVEVDYNFFNSLAPFAAGTWYWRVGYDNNADGVVDQWSSTRSFIVSGTEAQWDRSGQVSALATLSALSGTDRPRFGPLDGDWATFKTFLESSPRGNDWLNQIIDQANRIAGVGGYAGRSWYVDPDNFFPPTDEDGGPLDADGVVDGKVTFDTGSGTAEWRSNDFGRVGQNLITVAFVHQVTGNPAYADAKDLLLRLAEFQHTVDRRSLSWPEFHGATTKQTTPITEYLALLYDWYYPDLTGAERSLVRDRVAQRVRQVFLENRSWRSDTQVYNSGVGIRSGSHPYQNFFWTLPGLLILAGEDVTADATMEVEDLLPLALDFLTGVTAGALYGPDDGAINEGVGYASEKQGAMLRTALMAEMMLNMGQAQNPFLEGHQRWISHTLFANYGRSPFGDQWSYQMRDVVLFNHQALTLLTGNPQAKARWNAEMTTQGDKLEGHTFSRPWTLMLAYQRLNANASVTPEPETARALFPESGWVMVGTDAPTLGSLTSQGARMIFQSRPRGGHSHSYRAENAFAWHAFGESLAAGGGSRRFPDAYSQHTMSHNAILINGRGQEWTNINSPSDPYVGRILAYAEGELPDGGSYVHWVGDASNAYPTLPGAGLQRWHRHVIFVDDSYFIIYDDLQMNEGADPAQFSWLLQADNPTPSAINIDGNAIGWTQNGVSAQVVFNRDADDLDIIHQSGTGAIADPTYKSGSGWAPDPDGNNIYDNPITGEDLLPTVINAFDESGGSSSSFAGTTRYYFSESEYAENQRTQNSLWVTNAEPTSRWQLMTALLAWPAADAAPEVTRLSNNRIQVTYGTTTRTISFDPTDPGDYTVDLNAYRAHAGEVIPEKPTVSARRSTATVREDSGEAPYFIIERTDNYGVSVTIPFTLTGTATLGIDYTASVTDTITIPAEENEVLIQLQILDDPILEADDTITLTLQADPAYNIAQASATITILDDEALSIAEINEAIAPGETREVSLVLANPHSDARTFTLEGLTTETGYKWNTSTNLTGESLVPTFTWNDLSASPTASQPTSYSSMIDGVARPVQIPIGFDFPFYGENKTHFTIQTNGFIYFGDGTELDGTHTNAPLPSSTVPFDAIFPLWDDLRIQTHASLPSTKIYWESTSPGSMTIQYDQVGFIGQSGARTATFQIVLRSDGSITFNYKHFDFANIAISYTVGFQNYTGGTALQMSHNVESGGGTFIPKGTDIDFAVHAWAPVQFLGFSDSLVTLQPGESISLVVTLDASQRLPGQFSDTLTITDTHDASTRTIPVLLTVTDTPPPAAPGDLEASRMSDTQIDLSWTRRSTDEDGFRIKRSLDADTNFTTVATLPAESTAFSDTDALDAANTRHYYRVVAFNTHGENASTTVAAGRAPAAPSAVAAVAVSPTTIEIVWSYAGPEDDAFFIERRLLPDGPWVTLAVVRNGETIYEDSVSDSSVDYAYRVTAFDADLSGPASESAAVVPGPPTLEITFPQEVYYETDGNFTATITRLTTLGNQWVRLSTDSDRISVPASVIIPNGQYSVDFIATINNDEIVNEGDIVAITAYAPTAIVGETFEGPVDSTLTGQNTGWGWGAAWTDQNGSLILIEPSLNYEKNGVIATPGTRAARLVDVGSIAEGRRVFPQQISGNSVWVSALLHRNSTNWGTQLILRETAAGGNWTRLRWAGSWLLEAGGTSVQLLDDNPQGVLLLVMHLNFETRQIHAYINPEVSGNTPIYALASATIPMHTEGFLGISRLDIGGRSNLDAFDELRVARSFAGLYQSASISRSLELIDNETLTPKEAWLATHFGTHLPEGDAAWDADPDGDGIRNLLEYALDGDPAVPRTAKSMTAQIFDQHFEISLFRAVEDIDYIVEVSSTLAPHDWQVIATNPGLIGEWVTVQAPDPITDYTRRFLRLRISE